MRLLSLAFSLMFKGRSRFVVFVMGLREIAVSCCIICISCVHSIGAWVNMTKMVINLQRDQEQINDNVNFED